MLRSLSFPTGRTLASALGVAAGLAVAVLIGRFSVRTAGPADFLRVGLGLLAVTAFVEPRLALIFLPPAIALSPELGFLGLPLRFEDLILAPLAAGWLARRAVNRRPLSATALTRPLLALLGVELIATLLGAVRGTATLTFTTYSGLFFWLKNAEVGLLYFIVADTLRTSRQVRGWAYLLALSGAGLALQGMVTHLRGGDLSAFIPDPKGGATYSLIALALIIAICLALALLLLVRQRWSRLLVGAALIPLAYSMVFSFSRQAYLGAGVALLVLVLLAWRRLAPFVVILAIVAVALAPDAVVNRVASLVNPGRGGEYYATLQYGVYTTRINAWLRRLPQALETNPATGMGLAALPPGDLDSQYLVQVYYSGLLGLALFLWLQWRTGQMGWRLYRRTAADAALRAVGLALLAATVGLAVAGIGGSPFIAVRSRELFWFLAALAAAGQSCLDRELPGRSNRP